MGFDGIPIDTLVKPGVELDVGTLLIEYSAAAQTLRRAGQGMSQVGDMGEMLVTNEHLTTLLRPLTQEIFLGVVLAKDSLSGKARYLMRVASEPLVKELM